MKIVRLGEICNIVIGRTPSRSEPSFWGGDFPWTSIADLNQGQYVRNTKEKISQAGAERSKLVDPGTTLLSFKLSIGKVAIAAIPLYTNEAIAALPLKDPQMVDSKYLLRALESLDLASSGNRAAMGKTLNKKAIGEIELPLPPVTEQRRIAAILDKADAIRQKRQQAIAHLDSLARSIFHEMFGSVRNTMTVAELAAHTARSIRTGPFGSQLLHEEFVSAGRPVLGIDNVAANEFMWKQRRYISEAKFHELKKYEVFSGDVLVTIMGTTGRCAVVPEGIPRAINTKHLCAITPNRNLVLPKYLQTAFLNHPITRQFLEDNTRGAIMAGLNMGVIKRTPIPVATLAQQEAFIGRLKNIEVVKERFLMQHGEELFSSLQSRAFRGEL